MTTVVTTTSFPGLWVILTLFVLVLLVLLVSFSLTIIRPNRVGVVERMGKFSKVLKSGFHFIIPFVDRVIPVSLARNNMKVEVNGVTHDNVSAFVGLNVITFIEDNGDHTENGPIFKSIYSINNPQVMIASIVDEQVRGMIVDFSHKDIFSKREEIGEEVEANLREKLSTFGIKIDSIQIKDISLDNRVMTAMNQVVESKKLLESATNDAEADKITKIKEAEAEKAAKILLGEGMAGQRMAIAEGFKDSIAMIRAADQSISGNDILEFLLNSSRIETLENIGNSKNTKLVYLNDNLEAQSGRRNTNRIAPEMSFEK